MFQGWTPADINEYQEAIRITDILLAGKDPAGMSKATRARWIRRRAEADAGNPKALLRKKSSGRQSVAKDLTEDAVNRLRRQRLKCGSTALTIQHFADDPLCPDEIREKILAMKDPHAIPLSLRRACNVTPEMEALYRGPVAYKHVAFKWRHDAIVVDPHSGDKRDLMAGDLYISDDMSRNLPFYFELENHDVETRANRGDKLARKYGLAVGRQSLYTMCGRGKWLGVTLIGCARDAYTSADVLRHMRAVLAEYGKPRIGWILEKGCWAAKTVDGTEVWVPEEERMKVVGGLQTLGFSVEHVHTSEGKALIEVGFNFLQSIMSLQDGAPDIGRKRGEMEREAKLMRRVQDGVLHPAEAGLQHFTEALDFDRKACVWANSRAKYGRIQNGVPDENWIRDTGRNPLKKLEPQDFGVFMPIKISTDIRGGCVEKKMAGNSFRFSIPDLFGKLGARYKLYVMFDDSNPAAGAEIYNLETGTRNIYGYKHMEYLGTAEWEKARPLFGYSDEVKHSTERGKQHARAFKAAYAGTGIFGKRATKAIESRDGKGNLESIEVSDPRPATAPAVEVVDRLGIRSGGRLPEEPTGRAGEAKSRRRILSSVDLVEA